MTATQPNSELGVAGPAKVWDAENFHWSVAMSANYMSNFKAFQR